MRYLGTSLAAAALLIACGDSTPPKGPGAIQISASSHVLEPSTFQFGITVDNGAPRFFLPSESDTYTLTGLAHGAHTVAVTGVPASCTGGATQTVNLAGDDTAKVMVSLTCARLTGDIKVNATTTGSDTDPDGYIINVDGVYAGGVTNNGTYTTQFFSAGTHSVALADVATNCTASAAQSAAVTAGGLVTLNFAINCTPVAILKLVGAPAGADRDVDGTLLSIDNTAVGFSTSTATYFRLAVGSHSWALSDVAPNCTLAGAASASLTVAGGDTVTVNGASTCTAIPQGTTGISIADAANDTLSNSANSPNQAHDIRNVSTRYAPGWLIVTLRYARTFLFPSQQFAAGMGGFLDIDVDENVSTGIASAADDFVGAHTNQGVDFYLDFRNSDSVSVIGVRMTSPTTGVASLIRYKIDADSISFFVPLAKMNNDDGNVTLSAIIGTKDRPTDIAPNSGNIVSHVPTGPMIAAARANAAPEPSLPSGRISPRAATGKWRR